MMYDLYFVFRTLQISFGSHESICGWYAVAAASSGGVRPFSGPGALSGNQPLKRVLSWSELKTVGTII